MAKSDTCIMVRPAINIYTWQHHQVSDKGAFLGENFAVSSLQFIELAVNESISNLSTLAQISHYHGPAIMSWMTFSSLGLQSGCFSGFGSPQGLTALGLTSGLS